MTIGYKLVSQTMETRNTQWKVGEKVTAKGDSNELCTDGVLHQYASPLMAVFFNPVHADIKNPRLFRVECSPIVADDGTKQGVKEQTLVEELPLPIITPEQHTTIAIKCALEIYKEPSFVAWAHEWLSGKNRSKEAADAAADAADAARAARAARAAAYAARADADAAAYAASNINIQRIIEDVVNGNKEV